jgi:hypothetical protein
MSTDTELDEQIAAEAAEADRVTALERDAKGHDDEVKRLKGLITEAREALALAVKPQWLQDAEIDRINDVRRRLGEALA